MWTVIARSEVWAGAQLDPEITASLGSYDCLLAPLYDEVLPTYHVGEERGRRLVGYKVTLTRFCRVREGKSDPLYTGGSHGQTTTQLY